MLTLGDVVLLLVTGAGIGILIGMLLSDWINR